MKDYLWNVDIEWPKPLLVKRPTWSNVPPAAPPTGPRFKVGDQINVKNDKPLLGINCFDIGIITRVFKGGPDITYEIEFDLLVIGQFTAFFKEIEIESAIQLHKSASLPVGMNAWSMGPTPAERIQRKDSGCCEQCGQLLPMSIHGLLACPLHEENA